MTYKTEVNMVHEVKYCNEKKKEERVGYTGGISLKASEMSIPCFLWYERLA